MARSLAILLSLVLAGACKPPPPAAQGPRPRIVSLQPNATEILFALGVGPNLVGATRYCDRPDAAKAVPRVGGILDVSLEAVLAARPDIVVGSPSVLRGHLADMLDASGVRRVPVVFETADDVETGIRAIGAGVGREAAAEALAASYRADLAILAGRAARTPPITVLMVVGRNPLVVAARSSYLGDLLARMGVTNAASSDTMPYPTWSLEQVIRAAPDVVVDGALEAGDLPAHLADAGLTAAREGRVVRVRDEALLRPGPGTGKAALDLADQIVRAVNPAPVPEPAPAPP
jgi:iron complex transport system substrate-binding protein